MAKAKVYLVGAGPGDVELVTLKGYRLICQADVLLYDHLIGPQLIDFARHDAEKISVGKFAGRHTMPQSEINKLLIEKAAAGKTVVRLKGGDPYLFGRGGEEAEACVEAGIDFEVVPGITSAFAAACYGGIPVTHRDCTSSVAVVTGHRRDEKEIEIPNAGTLIFLMSVVNIGTIVDSVLKAGWPSDTKMAAVEHGTCYDQRVITGTLTDFVSKVEQAKLRTPAIFIVGKVVEMQEKLDWFTKKPNILVLGNHPARYGYLGNIVYRRVIDCVPIDDYSDADKVIEKIGRFDWIVFTSVNGAKYLMDRLFAMNFDARALASAKIAAIGKTTAHRLKDFGLIADIVPSTESSAGLLEEFRKLDMTEKKVLLPQALVSSDQLPAGLIDMQAIVEQMPVYKTVEIDPGDIDFDFIDQILFTSGSTVRAFVNRFGKVPENVKSYCLGPPTLKEAQKFNIDAQLLPGSSCYKRQDNDNIE
ncbi:MAG: uroporphyrinogen-III C-methyltransferase [Phycisphaerae bacterium]|nr:uroporphyrinogen-III C-methyltransferase [Phycisphaerae bacterium]